MNNKESIITSDLDHDSFISIAPWMINELKLAGNSLILFAYIFIQSLDNVHPALTDVPTLAKLCNVTNQTLVRTVEKLPYLIKSASQDHTKGFYMFNYYRIDYLSILQLLEQTGNKSYQKYIDYYRKRIEANNPKHKKDTDKYINDALDTTHQSEFNQTNIDDILQKVSNLSADQSSSSITDILKALVVFSVNTQKAVNDLCATMNKEHIITATNNKPQPKSVIPECNSDDNVNNTVSNNTNNDSNTITEPKRRFPKGGRDPRELLGKSAVKKKQEATTAKATNSLLKAKSEMKVTEKPKTKKELNEIKKAEKEEAKQQTKELRKQAYRNAALNYVLTKEDNNQELLELLYLYIDNSVFCTSGISARISVDLFVAQMNDLKKYHSLEDRIDSAGRAAHGKYQSLVYEQKCAIEAKNRIYDNKQKIPKVIETFLSKFEEDTTKTKELLNDYWETVCVPRNLTYKQFELLLKELTDKGLTYEQIHNTIEATYSHNYSSWVKDYMGESTGSTLARNRRNWADGIIVDENMTTSKFYGDRESGRKSMSEMFNDSNNTKDELLEEREKAVTDMFNKYYFYQYPELKETLLRYVRETPIAKTMTYRDMCEAIEYMVIHQVDVKSMLSAIEVAINNNYKKLGLPDNSKEVTLKKRYGSMEKAAQMFLRIRAEECEQEKKRNPNDPRFKDMLPVVY